MTPDRILQNLILMLYARRKLWCVLFLALMVLTVFAGYLLKPSWHAGVLLMVQSNPRQRLTLFADDAQPAHPTTPTSHAQSLVMLWTGTDTAQRMVRRFELDERVRQRAEAPANLRDRFKVGLVKMVTSPILLLQRLGILQEKPVDWEAKAVKDFQKGLFSWVDAEVVQGSDVISLTLRGDTPELANQVLDAMIERLQEALRTLTEQESTQVYASMQTQVQLAEQRLLDAQTAVQQFKQQHRVISLPEEARLLTARLNTLRTDYHQVRHETTLLGTALEQALPHTDGSDSWIEIDSPSVAADPLIQRHRVRYSDRLSQRSALLSERRPLHPDVVAIDAELRQIGQDMNRELHRVLQMLRVRTETLKREISDTEVELTALPALENTLARLTANAQIQQQNYQTLRSRAEVLRVTAEAGTGDITLKLIDRTLVPSGAKPDFPDWVILGLACLFFAFGGATGGVLFLEYWRDPIPGRETLLATTVPLLGVLPPRRKGRRTTP